MLSMKKMPSNHSKLVRSFFAVLASSLLFFTFSSYFAISVYHNNIQRLDHLRQSYVNALKPTPLRSLKEETSVGGGNAAEKATTNPLVPPRNASEAERIAWLVRSLPELEIFKPAREFHSRVVGFFDKGCDVRVFMTWIAPVDAFRRREALAMESLFKAHPKGCLVILSRSMDGGEGRRVLQPLLNCGFRVDAIAPDLSFLVSGTPAETWLEDLKAGKKDPGEISLAQNLSNLMRLAALYKYGGIYLDTDFIVTNLLTGLRNSIGAQSSDAEKKWTRLNNAVLVFDAKHPLVLSFIEEFAASFDGNKWGHNGPYLVSRVVERVGPSRPGLSFTVHPRRAFYTVDWTKIGGLFSRPENETQASWVEERLGKIKEETYGVHLWSRQSSRLAIEEGSVMGRLVSQVCIICKHIYTA